MTEQAATATTQSTPQANGAGIIVHEHASSGDGDTADAFEANKQAMIDQIRAEGFAVDGGDGDGEQQQEVEAAPVPAEPTRDQAAEERRARLAALHARNRERVDDVRRRADTERLSRELAEARQRALDLEKRTSSYVDPASLDEARFMALAEQSKVTPEALAAFIQQRSQNPERFAAEAAQRALDPKLSAQEREIAALKDQLSQFIERQEQREAQVEQQRQTHQFLSAVAETTGVAAKYLAAEGHEQFLRIAEKAAQLLPAGASQRDLYDQIEDILETDGRAVYEKLASIYGPNGSSTASHTSPNRATAQANTARATTTVTNQIAQERSSVVNEDDFGSLPFEERLERLKRAM